MRGAAGACASCGNAGEAGSASGGSGAAAGGAGVAGAPTDAGTDSGTTGSLTLSEVSLWQSLRVPLMVAGGDKSERDIPIIRDKPGLLRGFFQPSPEFAARELKATLTLQVSGATQSAESSQLVSAASSVDVLASSFNFPLEASEIALDTRIALEIGELDGGAPLARYPAQGLAPINGHGAGTKAATMDVVIVPIVIAGIMPDVSDAMLRTFHDRMLSMYPISALNVSVRAPVVSSINIGPDLGWGELLDFLYALRASDAPPANSYYYGIFTPAATFDDYCVQSCTVGISQVASAGEVAYRGAIGLDIFPDGSGADAPDTMAHELGHALGREHAPCGVSDSDPNFPYVNGSIGVWGYDSAQGSLLDPRRTSDVMSYCTPDWPSDYTYIGVYERLATVAGQRAQRAPSGGTPFRRVIVNGDGSLALGGSMPLTGVPRGSAETLTLHDRRGAKLRETQGYFQAFADARSTSGFLLVEEAALAQGAARTLRRGARELTLR